MCGLDFALDLDVVDLQIVVAQGQSFIQHLADIHLLLLRLALAGERQQVLHHAMSALRLLEEFADEVGGAVRQPFAFQQLGIAQNRGQRIVQFVRYSGDQLSDRRHLFALQQLLLGVAQVFVGAAGFFVEPDFLDGGGQLPADRDQQTLVVAGVLAALPAADTHNADGFVFAPQQHPDPGRQPVGANELRHQRGKMRQIVGGDHLGARTGHQIAKAIGEFDFGEAGALGAALSPTGAAAEGGFVGVAKIDRTGLRAQQRDHLAQREVQNFVQIERLGGDDRHGIQRIQFAIAAADFIFGALLLGHIEQEALVALDLSFRVAGGEAALHGAEQGSILAAQA